MTNPTVGRVPIHEGYGDARESLSEHYGEVARTGSGFVLIALRARIEHSVLGEHPIYLL